MRGLLPCVVASFAAACGGGSTSDASVDSPGARFSWTFVDASGAETGCPAGDTTVEITMWNYPPSPGGSCTNAPNAVVMHEASFPCEAGEGYVTEAGTPRLDVKLSDGRVYARFVGQEIVGHHVSVVTPRGFVALHWQFYNQTTMMERWCSTYDAVDTTWLGQFAWLGCQQGDPTTAVLPGQPIGDHTFAAWVTGRIERCGNETQKKALSATLLADQTTDVSVQFTTTQ